MPEPGDTLNEGGFMLRVESLEAMHIGRVVIQRLPEEDEPGETEPGSDISEE